LADDRSVQRARRNRKIEAAALAMLAILPLVPYFTFLLRTGVARFGVTGDLAIMEHATRQVWTGATLVGAPSRFGWSQPGALFFFLAAPLQAMFSQSSTGIYVAATFVNAASAGGLVASARMFARRSHAIAALFVILAWFTAFGDITASPWPPFLIVLPLLAFLFNAAMIARGKSNAVYPALFFGTLAAQTHVAAMPTVIASVVVSVVAFFIGTRGRDPANEPDVVADRWRVGIAAAIGLILFVPTIVDQLIATTGNFSRIVTFFVKREAPIVPLGQASQEWMTMLGWMPYRIAHLTIIHEDFVPWMAQPHEMYIGESSYPAIVASIQTALAAVCAMIAVKRKDVASVALLAIGGVATAVAIGALQAIVGPSTPALVFWSSAASSLVWIGIVATVLSAFGAALLKAPKFMGATATPFIIFGLTSAVVAASLQRWSLSKHPAGPGSHPELRPDIAAVYGSVRERLLKDNATPVVHLNDSLGDIALGFVLELEKDRIDVRVPSPDRSVLVGIRSEERLQRPLHLWVGSQSLPHRLSRCAEVIGKSGDLVVLGSPKPLTACP
jgi:hypothetical protein